MPGSRALIVTDNPFAAEIAKELGRTFDVDLRQSPAGNLGDVQRLDVKAESKAIASTYDVVISVHCKQLFPADLVRSVRCINVHPGFNPDNRGWSPQVFSIINGKKCGVTIHEMDEKIDFGRTIVQQECPIGEADTSGTVYERIMAMERAMLLAWFPRLLTGDYDASPPPHAGNLNYLRDFEALKEIDRSRVGTFGEFIDLLRALTHPPYRNAYFLDSDGNKVFVSIHLEPTGKDSD